jgi:hypothetical protein
MASFLFSISIGLLSLAFVVYIALSYDKYNSFRGSKFNKELWDLSGKKPEYKNGVDKRCFKFFELENIKIANNTSRSEINSLCDPLERVRCKMFEDIVKN